MSFFGQTSAAPTATGFGSTPSTGFNTAPKPGGFTFGGGGTTSSATTTPSLFGSTSTTTPSFGLSTATSQPQQQATTGFGSTNTFGGLSTQTSTAPTSSTNNMTPQQRDKMIYELLVQKEREDWQQRGQRGLSDVTPENIWQSMALMKSWWDPDSPNCRFKTYFYNMVPTQEVHLYQRPPNQDQKAWEDAQKKNPDPTCMVPTLAIGFGDIQKRMEVQSQQSQAHKSKLLEIDEKIKKMKESTLRDNATKLMEAKRQYMEITQRVIKFLKHTQVLRQKGLSITPEEEMMRTRFQSIQDQLQQSEQFHGTLSQMWAQLQLIKESGRKYGSIGGVDEWDSVSSSHVEEITKILDEQQRGIQHTIEVLECDTKDVNTLLQQQRQLQLQDRLQHLR
ncbi:nucleoporin complex subunit 54-domain-containing protein [Halteromyces radiatus]|uniref:nucleoporin complex subunit 54-domain-containing protein n=1 Tax=Halteromyces radiatus TaxID=101107 RepID=UPI00221E6EBD|nr:nucleoporin complex subunit 54-domain-containing protein [Halteromyces radiatus]KAI8093339.1 nucleoporin complex subunit 54-domain-containing protein [Halteromyces radiatus]